MASPERIQEITDEYMAQPVPTYFARFYLSGLWDWGFVTDENRIVTDVIGPEVKQGFKDKWIGKHISDVENDVRTKLYHTVIHHKDWATDEETKRHLENMDTYRHRLDRYQRTAERWNDLISRGESLPEDASLKELEENKKNDIIIYNAIIMSLNRKRHLQFCKDENDPVNEYFKYIGDDDAN